MDEVFERSVRLLGKEQMEKIQGLTVLVVGLGGVGSYAAEGLARLGVGQLIIIDKDVVEITNINRQLYALHSTLGKTKVSVAEQRIHDINPNAKVVALETFLTAENVDQVLASYHIDYIVDAIDTITAKVALIKWSQAHQVPVIVCTGMGNRLDPTKLEIVNLNQTSGDPVCKKLRELCKKEGLILSQIRVIYSLEKPIRSGENNVRTPSSVVFVPATAGLLAAHWVLEQSLR